MELQHLNVKFFVEPPYPDLEPYIPVFHRWIQKQVFAPALLIDVADYRHVHQGPGIVLIGYEYDFNLDESDGRLGLRFNQKVALPGTTGEKLKSVLAAAARGLELLEKENAAGIGIVFNRQDCEISVNDRALAPNTPETLEKFKPEFEKYFSEVFGKGTVLKHNPDPRARFGFLVTSDREFAVQGL